MRIIGITKGKKQENQNPRLKVIFRYLSLSVGLSDFSSKGPKK